MNKSALPSRLLLNCLFSFLFLCFSFVGYSQTFNPDKNTFSIYWGWNVSGYTDSDIDFVSENYNFTLYDIKAKDRQSKFSLREYFGPGQFTIPQYNFRLAYVFREDWNISFGIDHMKYVAEEDQKVIIDGNINNTQTSYDGQYDNEEITLSEDFLQFEHTDGLNYLQLTAQHQSPILDHKVFQLAWIQGFGLGAYTPRSEIKLLKYEESDFFHLAGFGFDGMLGLRLSLFENFFVQSEFKAGYVNLPRIVIGREGQVASQQFFYLQQNVVFGACVRFSKKEKE